MSSRVRAARRSASMGREAMRYCGIDVSAKPDRQQLCTLHERRGPEGLELVATFYEPGTVDQVARTVLGFGRRRSRSPIDAPFRAPPRPPRARRAAARPARPARGPLRARAGLRRAALPPPPAALPGARGGGGHDAVAGWIAVGFELFDALDPLGVFRPRVAPTARSRTRSPRATCASGASARPIRTRSSAACSGTGRRPSARRRACSSASRR